MGDLIGQVEVRDTKDLDGLKGLRAGPGLRGLKASQGFRYPQQPHAQPSFQPAPAHPAAPARRGYGGFRAPSAPTRSHRQPRAPASRFDARRSRPASQGFNSQGFRGGQFKSMRSFGQGYDDSHMYK